MIIAIHQPQFMPWLGYFDKMDSCDAFVLLDNVQYKKNEYQNRNRIKTSNGWQWLTVPACYKFPQKINEVLIDNSVNWQKKHICALQTNYGKSPFFEKYIKHFKGFYDKDWNFQYRIEGDKIYDKDWNLRYHKEGNRVYDKSYNLRYKVGNKIVK